MKWKTTSQTVILDVQWLTVCYSMSGGHIVTSVIKELKNLPVEECQLICYIL